MNDKILLTKDGVEKLNQEMQHLLNVVRPDVIAELQAARAQGDLSENADYDAARDRQAQVEARIKEIDNILAHVKIIEEKKGSKRTISLGATVTLKDLSDNEESTYTIVGSVESDPINGKISNESALAKAIDGKKVGDIVNVETPVLEYQVEILKIERK